jgi:hypothetical protein
MITTLRRPSSIWGTRFTTMHINLMVFYLNSQVSSERHTQTLMGRNLSIQGRSHVVNWLILSRIWHMLRVVDPPAAWLKQCERTVRNFVCPYGLKPSWKTICSPKNQGGVSVIHMQHQNQALKLVFIQKCVETSSSSFILPVLRSLFRCHTGHASLLTLLLMPKEMIPLLKQMPPLQQLARILTKLPPMPVTQKWPSHLLIQIPVRSVVQRPLHITSHTNAELLVPLETACIGTGIQVICHADQCQLF